WRVVLIGLVLLDVLILAGGAPGLPLGGGGSRKEEQLVDVGDALAREAAGGLAARGVAVEARELDVTIGPVLDELERPGADVLLELSLARRVHDLLGIDEGCAVDVGQDRQQAARGLLQPDLDAERPLRLDGLDIPEEGFGGAGCRAPGL